MFGKTVRPCVGQFCGQDQLILALATTSALSVVSNKDQRAGRIQNAAETGYLQAAKQAKSQPEALDTKFFRNLNGFTVMTWPIWVPSN